MNKNLKAQCVNLHRRGRKLTRTYQFRSPAARKAFYTRLWHWRQSHDLLNTLPLAWMLIEDEPGNRLKVTTMARI